MSDVPAGFDEVAELRAELDAARRWQAQRIVALSQDPMCVKWMRESEAAGRVHELIDVRFAEVDKSGIDDGGMLAEVVSVSLAEVRAALDGECGYGRCYCGGCVL